jgi:hypothetical protein
MSATWPPANWKPAKRRPTRPPSEQEIKFCSEFVSNGGNAAAAVALAWPNVAPGNRKKYGRSVLDRPSVYGELERLRRKIARVTDVKPERVIMELAKIALEPGLERFMKVDQNGRPYWDLTGATDDDKRLIASLDTREYKEGRGPGAATVQQFKIARDEKLKAMELLMKAMGMLSESVNVKHQHELTIIDRLQQGRERILQPVIDVSPQESEQ